VWQRELIWPVAAVVLAIAIFLVGVIKYNDPVQGDADWVGHSISGTE
jgi:hypothetical protein